jgi:hypothetical protein
MDPGKSIPTIKPLPTPRTVKEIINVSLDASPSVHVSYVRAASRAVEVEAMDNRANVITAQHTHYSFF